VKKGQLEVIKDMPATGPKKGKVEKSTKLPIKPGRTPSWMVNSPGADMIKGNCK